MNLWINVEEIRVEKHERYKDTIVIYLPKMHRVTVELAEGEAVTYKIDYGSLRIPSLNDSTVEKCKDDLHAKAKSTAKSIIVDELGTFRKQTIDAVSRSLEKTLPKDFRFEIRWE